MAGFSKNPRHGKRPSSSSYSPCSSTLTMVIFVAFCLFGVWMFTSSSFVPSQATTITARRSSSSSSNPPHSHLSRAAKAGSADQDAGSEEEESRTESSREQQQGISNGEVEDARRSDEETPQEQAGGNKENQEKNGEDAANAGVQNGEESQLQSEQPQSDAHSNEEQQNDAGEKRQDLETSENQQEMHDEQLPVIENEEKPTVTEERQQQTGAESDENQQQTQQQQDVGNDEETQQQQQEQEQEQNTRTNELENQQDTQHQQIQTNELDNQQDTQLQHQEIESENDRNQQQTQTEIEQNHDRIEQLIEEKTSGSNQQSEEGGSEAQLQTQQQTDVDGSSEKQQQEQDDSSQTGEGSSGEEGKPQGEKFTGLNAGDSLPDTTRSEVPNDGDGKKKSWKTQADESQNEKERLRDEELQSNGGSGSGSNIGNLNGYEWELCNVTAGPDYIPCLDNEKAIKQLHGFHHYEHRERHCPEESPSCLVPLPNGYKHSIEWPKSRDKIWYNNIPHTKLAEVKGHQNWVKVTGQYLMFPGGGTQFIHGALHYIDFLQQSVRDIAWGKHSRVILDVGCGVASFGGYLFERDVLAMSFAPKDEHEAQVQFALERGIPAISAVMGSQRLQFPGRVFDLIHCARCRVPWHADGGTLLLELNRLLRPGGYFVWSATPVYQKLKEDVEIWNAMKSLTASMCWDLVTIKKDKLNGVGAAFFRKPTSNECYDNRKHQSPPLCKEDDDPNAAWYIPLKPCMHRVPVDSSVRGSQWPEEWPIRLRLPPYWINSSQVGVYGKSAPDDFTSDYEHWKRVVTKSYLTGFGIDWSRVRNVMDMRAVYGGFAAALKDMKLWVMNVVNIDSPDTLPIIYERGLFGIYHDWCESFSTYPRTYDLLHADHLFSQLKKRCKIVPVMAEVDRLVRPGGKLIVRDKSAVVSEVENLLKSLHWEVHLTFSKNQEGILCAEKSDWRPEKLSDFS